MSGSHCMQDVLPEEVAELLPQHQPRYVAYSYCYKHDDGRISYPLCFIYISPSGMYIRVQDCNVHVLMRDEKEGRKGQTNNKVKQHSTPKAVTFPNCLGGTDRFMIPR